MDTNSGKDYLIESDLDHHPIWARNEVNDLIYPVSGSDDLPDDSRNLYIRALFTTSNDISLKGFIIGVKNIFCVAIFCGNEIFYLNKNLLKDCTVAIGKISKIIVKDLQIRDFSPLKFETQIDLEGFKNIQGEFDLSKPRTDVERLDF